PEIKNVGDDPMRPGIVHRLDKEVSGLMVIAKNQLSFENLKKQFKKREINKEYIALVYGKIEPEEGEINFPIRRAQSGYKMAALPIMNSGLIEKKRLSGRDAGTNEALLKSREALSLFKVIKRFINYTLLQVRIKTGRTHQIRVHFAAYGHPLVGDNLYSTKKTRVKNKKLNLGQVFLFSKRLAFSDLAGKTQEFELDLSPELKVFLEKIR
ncbi:MAG: RNA pseudouridine synthase, partial [Candidatus Falkowbacteria bacterium]|nr:RNA pseudouridine synthase [Candidatus Falkowbacteria bacterium]